MEVVRIHAVARLDLLVVQAYTPPHTSAELTRLVPTGHRLPTWGALNYTYKRTRTAVQALARERGQYSCSVYIYFFVAK